MSTLSGIKLFRSISRLAPALRKSNIQIRCISTSKKNRDTATVSSEAHENVACEVDKKKNWMSYGFSIDDYEEDRHSAHMIFFFGISLLFCGGGFVLMYRPDFLLRDWAQREAFLEIRRREALGLPMVDKDYIPESKVILPSDEELGDTEIVV